MSTFVPLSSVTIAPTRQRKVFDLASINELKESIETNSLLHAPVVRQVDGVLVLVAGERRLRALTDLVDLGVLFHYEGELVPAGHIPVTNLGDLDPLAAWEAELEENIRRVDLTWQEKAQATASLMELRQAQAADSGVTPPSVVELAAEIKGVPATTPREDLGFAPQQTRDELIVSRFLKDPEVAKASTLAEAKKILKKRDERERSAALAQHVGRTFSSEAHTLLNEDSLAWMRNTEPSGRFDIILTDPPYGMGADEFGDSGQGVAAGAHFYKDDYETWQHTINVFAVGSFRLAAADAHCYAFCDIDRFHEFREAMTAAGWKVHRTPLIWHNPDGFRAPWPEQGPQRKYELILYAVKGGKKVTSVREDVLKYSKDAGLGHPAQKPVNLLIDLLKRSAAPGDQVLDPFGGSGSTVAACHELKLSCTMLEQNQGAFGIAVKRVQELAATEKELF